MNREIQFRGKRVDNDKWVEGSLVLQGNTNRVVLSYIIPIVSYNQDGFIGRFEKVYTRTLGQYTGIKDRNGKEIFEGDVVNWFNGHQSENMIVCFANGSFEFKRFQVKNNYYWINVDTESISIIGNIYDNPELTK